MTPETQALFAEAIKLSIQSAAAPARQAVVSALGALKGYGDYLEETNKRVSTFKSFANPSKPVRLLDHFVTMKFTAADERTPDVDQDDILEQFAAPQRLIISATAGFGKSMAMRFLALSLYENPRGKIPLFIELRHLNRVTSVNI